MKETRYFYVPNAESSNELPAEEAAHASRVLRLESGDEVFLIDGAGCFFKAQLTLVTKSGCLYDIVERLPKDMAWTNSHRNGANKSYRQGGMDFGKGHGDRCR